MSGNDENNGKNIDIDWSQIDTTNFTLESTSLEATPSDWNVV